MLKDINTANEATTPNGREIAVCARTFRLALRMTARLI
jgi:hypothetical protein